MSCHRTPTIAIGTFSGEYMLSAPTKIRKPQAKPSKQRPDAVLQGAQDQIEAQSSVEAGGVTEGTPIRRTRCEHVSAGQDRCSRTDDHDFYTTALAHELGNALSPLMYGAAVIRCAGPESATGRAAFGRLDRQLSHLQSVLDGMLDLHRAAHGNLVLQIKDADLGVIVENAVDTVASLIKERNHRLSVRVAPDARLLRVDQVRIEQVLVNLLKNAARYTDRGGEISLNASRDGDLVIIRVRDNGIGIAPDLLPCLFDGFVQGDFGRGGVGIGLALVRRFVELHGGRVSVTSNGSGTGSVFVVTLPL
jgi:signal transduction histidine kinase